MASFFGTVTVPSSVLSSPAIIRKSVVLPEPFGPTSPAFSPGLSWNEASTKTTWRPYCLLTPANEIMDCGKQTAAGGCSVSDLDDIIARMYAGVCFEPGQRPDWST